MSAKNKKKEMECGICFEIVTVRGRLNKCDHAYCYECIVKWSEVTNRCPLCKKNFSIVSRICLQSNNVEHHLAIESKEQRHPSDSEYDSEEIEASIQSMADYAADSMDYDYSDGFLVPDHIQEDASVISIEDSLEITLGIHQQHLSNPDLDVDPNVDQYLQRVEENGFHSFSEENSFGSIDSVENQTIEIIGETNDNNLSSQPQPQPPRVTRRKIYESDQYDSEDSDSNEEASAFVSIPGRRRLVRRGGWESDDEEVDALDDFYLSDTNIFPIGQREEDDESCSSSPEMQSHGFFNQYRFREHSQGSATDINSENSQEVLHRCEPQQQPFSSISSPHYYHSSSETFFNRSNDSSLSGSPPVSRNETWHTENRRQYSGTILSDSIMNSDCSMTDEHTGVESHRSRTVVSDSFLNRFQDEDMSYDSLNTSRENSARSCYESSFFPESRFEFSDEEEEEERDSFGLRNKFARFQFDPQREDGLENKELSLSHSHSYCKVFRFP